MKVKLALPLEACHGRRSSGGDLNHKEFHQRQIVLLPKEQVWRESLYCIHNLHTNTRLQPTELRTQNHKYKEKKSATSTGSGSQTSS